MQRKRKLKRKPNKTICKPGDFTKQFGVKLNNFISYTDEEAISL
jgi:hypothetical protein